MTTPQVSASDWSEVKAVAKVYGIDPYLLVAIGMHETGWGTQGDGRAPSAGHGNVLGVGSYDSGSTSQWEGLSLQLVEGAATLKHNGVTTIADVQSGKLHVTPDGVVKWASADTQAAGYPWSTAVVNIATTLEGQKALDKPLPATSSAYDTDAGRAQAYNMLSTGPVPGQADVGKNYGPGLSASGIAGVTETLANTAASAITSPFDWFKKHFTDLLYLLGGAVLVILGVVSLMRGVTPAGAAMKLVGKG